MGKRILILMQLLILLTLTGVGCVNKSINTTSQPLVGNDKDIHGCIGSAGYSWCEPKNKCLRIWEELCYSSDEQAVQYLLAQKYNKLAADITLRIKEKTTDYMSGTAFFATKGLPAPGEGGLFLAARVDNQWQIVYSGNGSIDCNFIKNNYHFPQNMLRGFCD
jgi:hypothetical protein